MAENIFPTNSTVIAHAGDGNFHTVILFDPKEEEQRKEAEKLNHMMVYKALSMEGTSFFFSHPNWMNKISNTCSLLASVTRWFRFCF